MTVESLSRAVRAHPVGAAPVTCDGSARHCNPSDGAATVIHPRQDVPQGVPISQRTGPWHRASCRSSAKRRDAAAGSGAGLRLVGAFLVLCATALAVPSCGGTGQETGGLAGTYVWVKDADPFGGEAWEYFDGVSLGWRGILTKLMLRPDGTFRLEFMKPPMDVPSYEGVGIPVDRTGFWRQRNGVVELLVWPLELERIAPDFSSVDGPLICRPRSGGFDLYHRGKHVQGLQREAD